MQIVEKSAEGLARVYTVTIASADIATRTDAKIVELAPQLNIKGFRKGKVPVVHVKRMYGKSIMGDLVNDLVQEGINAASSHNGTRAASQADIKNIENLASVMDGKADLVFDVELDIMPDFTPVDMTTLNVTRPVAVASDEEIDGVLGDIAKQSTSFEPKEGEAVDGDQVVCDFVGKLGEVEFEGGKADGATVVLGSNSYIPGFEEQLVGVKAGETRVLNVTFPAEYGVPALAGQAATFDVTVSEVKTPKDTPIDDELAKNIGLSDLATLKEAIKKNLEDQMGQLSRQKAKRSLLDALDGTHSFELPPKMLAAEFEAIWAQVQQDKEAGNEDPEDAGKSEEDLKAEYNKIAERRVRLGLVLAEVGRINGVEVKDDEVARALQQEAARFPGQEKQVYDFFQKNPNAVASLRAPLYEEKVVDFMLQMANVTDVTVSREELEKEDDEAPALEASAPAAEVEAKPAKKAKAKKAEAASTTESPTDAAETTEAVEEEKPAPKKKAPAKKKPAAE